jgi:hypothetical protein
MVGESYSKIIGLLGKLKMQQKKENLDDFLDQDLLDSLHRFDKTLDRLEECLDKLEKEIIHNKQET